MKLQNKNINNSRVKKIVTIVPMLILFMVIAIIKITDLKKQDKEKEVFAFRFEGTLTFLTKEKNIDIDIEKADTDYDRQLGLMFRNSLGENEGMLFIFDYESIQSFWMKNTRIPLDIIYINSKKEIVSIYKNTSPYSESSLPSSKPAQYVVEVNAGWTTKNNIQIGDKVEWQ